MQCEQCGIIFTRHRKPGTRRNNQKICNDCKEKNSKLKVIKIKQTFELKKNMLEQKIRLKNALQNKEPPHRVAEFWKEYCEAYDRLHKPSEHHIKDYLELSEKYTKYMIECRKK